MESMRPRATARPMTTKSRRVRLRLKRREGSGVTGSGATGCFRVSRAQEGGEVVLSWLLRVQNSTVSAMIRRRDASLVWPGAALRRPLTVRGASMVWEVRRSTCFLSWMLP